MPDDIEADDIEDALLEITTLPDRRYKHSVKKGPDRFGEYPDVVAYLLEIGLAKSYLDQAFVKSVERQQNAVIIHFEKISQQLYLTQDYFEALSMTNLKARIGEKNGLIEVIFDVRNKKIMRF